MKKTITLSLALILTLTLILTGCGATKDETKNEKSPPKNKISSKYKNYKPPKDLPIYPGAKKFGDIDEGVFEDDTFLKWTYKTDASANEIYEFFKTEFEKMGYLVGGWGTYISYDKFGITAEDEATGKYHIQVSYYPSEDLEGEVTEDTKSREYLISVNIEEWEKK